MSERFSRPNRVTEAEPPKQIPQWKLTVAEQVPTDEERVVGRAGIAGARAALHAAHRPVPTSGVLANSLEEDSVWKPKRPKESP